MYEATNVVRKRMRREPFISQSEALALLDQLLAFPIQPRSPPELHRQTLIIANLYDLAASYDAHYIALAQLLECEFWTGDRRLHRKVGESLPFMKRIGDYSEGTS